MKKTVNRLFPMLKEIAFLNNKVVFISYTSGRTSHEILFDGSKQIEYTLKHLI